MATGEERFLVRPKVSSRFPDGHLFSLLCSLSPAKSAIRSWYETQFARAGWNWIARRTWGTLSKNGKYTMKSGSFAGKLVDAVGDLETERVSTRNFLKNDRKIHQGCAASRWIAGSSFRGVYLLQNVHLKGPRGNCRNCTINACW